MPSGATIPLLAAALAWAALPRTAVADSIIPMIPAPYDETFTGEATYYGTIPDGAGNCAIQPPLPAMYDGMIPVALNNDQYGDSVMCGACIEGEGSGEGAGADPVKGPFKAYVTDRLVVGRFASCWGAGMYVRVSVKVVLTEGKTCGESVLVGSEISSVLEGGSSELPNSLECWVLCSLLPNGFVPLLAS